MRLGLCLGGFGDGDGTELLGQFEGFAPLDLGILDLAFLGDATGFEDSIGLDPGLLDLLACGDLGALRELLIFGAFASQFGALLGAGDLDFPLLLQARAFGFEIDIE